MSFEQGGLMPLDYNPVALPGSALRFRGPMVTENGPAVVCIGGSETFGRFIQAPYPTQLAAALDGSVLNLGVVNAGLDVMMNDPAIAAAIHMADAVVLQVVSAHNMTNRFYTVHPRRNDRFVAASAMLRTIYPAVDFTEFHFTRHLLKHLRSVSEDRFGIVRAELEAAWVARMRKFLRGIAAPVHLVWMSQRAPDTGDDLELCHDPLFVTSAMLDAVCGEAESLTTATEPLDSDTGSIDGKYYGPREEAAARLLPGPALHDRAAAELLKKLQL